MDKMGIEGSFGSLRSPNGTPFGGSSSYEDPCLGEMELSIGNTRTYIHNAPSHVLDALDKALRYPTQMAIAMESGFVPPDEGSNWDGWIRFLRKPKTMPPYIPTGLIYAIDSIADQFSIPVKKTDTREYIQPGVPDREEIPLRDYQKLAVEQAILSRRGVLDMPPRSGKTRAMCELHRCISLPTIWIAPTDRIVSQTVNVLASFFGKNYAVKLVGKKNQEKASLRNVVVCTAATAALLSQEFYKTREMLVIDEFHHAGAKSYRKIWKLCDHIYYRYGMSGTFFRSGEDEMEMHALLSHTIFKVSPKDLMDRGYLVPTQVVFVPVDGPKLRGIGTGSYNTCHGKYGIQEHGRRNLMAAYAAVLLQQVGNNVLVLIDTKAQGNMVKQMIKNHMRGKVYGAEFDPVEFISTDIKRPIQARMIESFLESDEIKILIGTSILGEGVDLPSCDALVYAKGQRAEVSLTQNAYRVCTSYAEKKNAIIVDFADRHHRKLLKHSMERMQVYNSIPIFDVKVLKDLSDFVDYLKK